MALHINSSGIQKEIDLDLDSAILFWGESPVPCTELRMADMLGLESDEKFECKRLDDGRLLFYSAAHDVDSIQVLLTQEESSLVETVEESHARSTSKMDYDESLIKRMTISDVVPGGCSYSSIFAQARTFAKGTCAGCCWIRPGTRPARNRHPQHEKNPPRHDRSGLMVGLPGPA